METWKPVPGYEDYLISDRGRLWNLRANKITTGALDYFGYVAYGLYKDGLSYPIKAHRLVAKAFIDNPQGKREVHHIDGNKQNNTPDNLMWVTRQEHGLLTREENRRKEQERETRWQNKLIMLNK